jgi:hypothetical protein
MCGRDREPRAGSASASTCRLAVAGRAPSSRWSTVAGVARRRDGTGRSRRHVTGPGGLVIDLAEPTPRPDSLRPAASGISDRSALDGHHHRSRPGRQQGRTHTPPDECPDQRETPLLLRSMTSPRICRTCVRAPCTAARVVFCTALPISRTHQIRSCRRSGVCLCRWLGCGEGVGGGGERWRTGVW